MRIKIDHIAKIEGHAGFVADIVEGNVTKARLNVLEGARLLEGILLGRSHSEVSQITARICGVCPVVHNLASLKALEAAMGVFPSKQTILLRQLLMMGQILNSHALHLFFFSLSDFFGFKDDLKLIKKYPAKTKEALAIRDFANEVIEVVGGRSIHPLTPEVGGFKRLPEKDKLERLFEKSKLVLKSAGSLAKFFGRLKYPTFERSCEFVSLAAPGEYSIYEGMVRVSEETKTIEEFMSAIQEFQVEQSAVKRSKYDSQHYMVGALSRLNHNAAYLNLKAKLIFKSLGLKLPFANPFYNILAQAIEIVHCIEEVQKILAEIKENGVNPQNQKFEVKAGKGYGAIEAPRGTLFYYYETDKDGLISNANIITPTAQNLARLEEDLIEYLPKLLKSGQSSCQEECRDLIKMLVRAYDPCLTCATH